MDIKIRGNLIIPMKVNQLSENFNLRFVKIVK